MHSTGVRQTNATTQLFLFGPLLPSLQRKLLAPTRWVHGDVALMCLSTTQLAYSWIVLPQVSEQCGRRPPMQQRGS